MASILSLLDDDSGIVSVNKVHVSNNKKTIVNAGGMEELKK
jgi:hypothetical protein